MELVKKIILISTFLIAATPAVAFAQGQIQDLIQIPRNANASQRQYVRKKNIAIKQNNQRLRQQGVATGSPSNGLLKHVDLVSLSAIMQNGVLRVGFRYASSGTGKLVFWKGETTTVQCAAYENNGSISNPQLGIKRAWTKNLSVQDARQDIFMKNIYKGNYQGDQYAILQCYIKTPYFDTNVRDTFRLNWF